MPKAEASKATAKTAATSKDIAAHRGTGRQKGIQNFSKEDIMELLRLVEDTLPMGNQSWESVKKEYNQYAERANQNERTTDNLRHKFNKVCFT
jgi:archaellum component FlaC